MDVILPQYIVSKSAINQSGSSVLLSSSAGTDPTSSIWASGTAYTTGAKVYYLDTEGVCKGCWCEYQALQNSTGKNPYSEPAYWLHTGAINMYKMFDQYNMTKTVSTTGNIVIYIYCKAITDIAFVEVQAKSVTIQAWNCSPSSSYPYTANISNSNKILIDGQESVVINLEEPLFDWYEYFFKDFDPVRTIAEPVSMTLYNNVIFKIEFEKYEGLDCEVGNVIAGRKYNIGSLQYGVSTGIIDYSKKEFNEYFGSHYIKEGNYRKIMDCDLLIENKNLKTINLILSQLRAKPTVWQGNQDDTSYDNLLIFGIPKSFNIIMSYFSHSEVNLEIEGLI